MQQLDIFEFLKLLDEAEQQAQREEEQEERDTIQAEAEATSITKPMLFTMYYDTLYKTIRAGEKITLEDVNVLESLKRLEL